MFPQALKDLVEPHQRFSLFGPVTDVRPVLNQIAIMLVTVLVAEKESGVILGGLGEFRRGKFFQPDKPFVAKLL